MRNDSKTGNEDSLWKGPSSAGTIQSRHCSRHNPWMGEGAESYHAAWHTHTHQRAPILSLSGAQRTRGGLSAGTAAKEINLPFCGLMIKDSEAPLTSRQYPSIRSAMFSAMVRDGAVTVRGWGKGKTKEALSLCSMCQPHIDIDVSRKQIVIQARLCSLINSCKAGR